MTSRKNRSNIPASVRQRLLNISRSSNEDFGLVLTRYAIERLLYRISQSEYADRFVLKGAILFTIWTKQAHRPTRDMDLLGFGDCSAAAIKEIFHNICELSVESDGLTYQADSIEVSDIRADQEYVGQRITLVATLDNARIPVQVDVGIGDVVIPAPQLLDFPAILEFPAPKLRAYSPETVVAEKLHAMVEHGMLNSRMKDYFDLWIMARDMSFDGALLVEAIGATFDRRKTTIPKDTPVGLSDNFALDKNKLTQWNAFLNRNKLDVGDITLADIIQSLRKFLSAPMIRAANRSAFGRRWNTSAWA